MFIDNERLKNMKQNKTICLDPEVIEAGNKKAEEKGLSFSQYIQNLIESDK